jgi:HEAT repeat protein
VELQHVAIMALGNIESDEAIPVLTDIAKKGSDRKLRSAAVTALGQIGTEKARAALVEILESKPKE